VIIDHLWRQQGGKYFFLATKSASGKWAEHFFARRDLGKIRRFLTDNADKDIYFCPHGFDVERRLKANAVLPSMLWADLDEVDPRECAIKPTIAIESSPGRFVGLWLTDKPVTEDLNRRMTYLLGADKGGWDVTQVLRVPGTINYKYAAEPRVRLLWDDGPTYTLKQLSKLLPAEEEKDVGDLDAREVYREYERKLPPWARRELMREDSPPAGKRSEMLWKLNHQLFSAGMTEDEAYVVLKASKWNKFAGRRSEDEQLRRELSKVLEERMDARSDRVELKEDYDDEPKRWLGQTMADVEEEEIDWIWYPYLARGELTIIQGHPSAGKSFIAQNVAVAICDGKKLPSRLPKRLPQGKVVYFDMENSSKTVTKKRLRMMGLENWSNYIQEEEVFSIDDEDTFDDVLEAIERERPVLVVFDTLNTYIGGADTHKASEAAQAIGKFRAIASRFNCAVLVVNHLTKGTREITMMRGTGSAALAGMARQVIHVGPLPDEMADEGMSGMALAKSSNAPKPGVMSFEIETTDLKKGEARLVWGDWVEGANEEDLHPKQEKKGEKKTDQLAEAVKWLREQLEGGPVMLQVIMRKAEALSITERTLRRAAAQLEVRRDTSGARESRTTMWALPD